MSTMLMNREQQAKRRKDAYVFYKEISRSNLNGEKRKEDLYKEVSEKFGYSNIQSVKGLVSQFKKNEKKDNEAKLNFARGIVEAILVVEETVSCEINQEELDFRYKLKLSEDNDDTVHIMATYNSDFTLRSNTIDRQAESKERVYIRKETFDHFSISDLKSGTNRLSALFQECYSILISNTK